jgi:hypothetical protein
MPTVLEVVVHSVPTRRRGLSYQFTPKHHGGPGHQGQAQWLATITVEQEFGVFNIADELDLSDETRRLYGILRVPELGVQFLGTRDEQIATFPAAREGESWHGYPVYPLASGEAQGRGGESGKPAKVVFEKMRRAGLLSEVERRRLMKGKHV